MPEIVAFKLKPDEALKMTLRPEQAAETLGVSLAFLNKEIRRGKIKVVKKGRGLRKVILITIAAINEYLQSSEIHLTEVPKSADEEEVSED
jgi:excisionase family DNA binding protein